MEISSRLQIWEALRVGFNRRSPHHRRGIVAILQKEEGGERG